MSGLRHVLGSHESLIDATRHWGYLPGRPAALPEGLVVLLDELAEVYILGKPFGLFPGDLIDV